MRSHRLQIVMFILLAFAFPANTMAAIQTFEDGLLTGWSAGGRRISGSGNSWGVSQYAGSQMAYLHHTSYTELNLSKTFSYSPGMVFSFDALFSVNGDTSPAASGSSAYYDMVNYWIRFYDSNGNLLGGRYYGAATTSYPYNNATTNPTPIMEFRPNGLQHYEHDLDLLASTLGIPMADVDRFRLSFNGYSSWWSGDDMIVRFDNVGTVPEPTAIALVLSGIIGCLSYLRRWA